MERSRRDEIHMIRKLKNGDYRLSSRKRDSESGERRHLGTFNTFQEAVKHYERLLQMQFLKRP